MFRFRSQIYRYGVALLAVTGAYALYALLAVPLIEGPSRVRELRIDQPIPEYSQDKSDLIGLIANDSWEFQPGFIIQTDAGKIYFQDHQELDDGSVELKPLTMLLNSKTANPDEPGSKLLIRSSEGAILKFDRPHSLGSSFGKLQNGRIMGDVSITRLRSSFEADDEIAIFTRNVQLLDQRIQTLENVEFRVGSNWGRGRHLIIDLKQNLAANPAGNQSITDTDGVRRMELVELERLQVKQASGTDHPGTDGIIGNQPSIVEVTCDGAFIFDFDLNKAQLIDNVLAVAIDRPGDELYADQLELFFAPHDGPGKPSTTPDASGPTGKNKGGLKLKTMVANGNPARINSKSRELSMAAEQITYQQLAQQIWLKSKQESILRQAQTEFRCPEFRYRIPADQSLGEMIATGNGRITRPASVKSERFDLRWQQQMLIRPDKGMKLVSIYGDAESMVGSQSLTAGEIHLWLQETEIGDRTGTQDTPSDPKSAGQKWQWDPAQLFAKSSVKVHSERIEGHCDELHATWPARQNAARQLQSRVLSATRPHRYVAKAAHQPTKPRSINRAWQYQQQQGAGSSGTRLIFSGQVVRTKLKHPKGNDQPNTNTSPDRNSLDPDFEFEELVIEGSVIVQQQPANNRGNEKPQIEITGDKLRILPQIENESTPGSERMFRMYVHGSSEVEAKLVGRGMLLSAPLIHIDQLNNRLWVDGPGGMKVVPPEKMQKGQQRPSAVPVKDQGYRQPKSVIVGWAGGMVFDGQQIYFERNVQTESNQESEQGNTRTRTSSQAINLGLNRFVSLSGDGNQDDGAEFEIKTIALVGHLDKNKLVFESSRRIQGTRTDGHMTIVSHLFDQQNELRSIRLIAAPWANMFADSDQLETSGPGIVNLWSKGGSNPLTRNASTSDASSDPEQIAHTQVKFDKSIFGQIAQKELVFEGNVRAIHGPVADWREQWNADQKQLPEKIVRLTSDQLQIAQFVTQASDQEVFRLAASGNAQMFGELFESSADLITYWEAQNKIVLQGTPRNDARLLYQAQPGQEKSPIVATKISYRLDDQNIQVDGFKSGVLNSGPIRNKRGSN